MNFVHQPKYKQTGNRTIDNFLSHCDKFKVLKIGSYSGFLSKDALQHSCVAGIQSLHLTMLDTEALKLSECLIFESILSQFAGLEELRLKVGVFQHSFDLQHNPKLSRISLEILNTDQAPEADQPAKHVLQLFKNVGCLDLLEIDFQKAEVEFNNILPCLIEKDDADQTIYDQFRVRNYRFKCKSVNFGVRLSDEQLTLAAGTDMMWQNVGQLYPCI